ncbi:MAG: hypothetical protein JNL76_07465 [Alphaproteobacteria bacterium]|nr:hypothetical protein [Alphaproteobacteria bacterium]
MGKIFHIGVDSSGGFNLTGVTEIGSGPSSTGSYLMARFGFGYDETTNLREQAMTQFPMPSKSWEP